MEFPNYLFLTFCSSPSRINGFCATLGQKIALKGSGALRYKGHGHRATEAKLNYSYKQQYGDLASVWQFCYKGDKVFAANLN